MHPYLPQLLSDIEVLINDPPLHLDFEVRRRPEKMPEMAELQFTASTTLETLTGIAVESIPGIMALSEEDCHLLAEAFKRLLATLNFEIMDMHDDFPDDAYIRLIVHHWNDTVQYQPLTGYEMEWCTGDEETCPYGKGCMFCGKQENKAEMTGLAPGVWGFFHDDGTRIDPLMLHIPGLCLDCMLYLDDDEVGNVLCTLTRAEYREGEEFRCYNFMAKGNRQNRFPI